MMENNPNKNRKRDGGWRMNVVYGMLMISILILLIGGMAFLIIEQKEYESKCQKETICYYISEGIGIHSYDREIYVSCDNNFVPSSIKVYKEIRCKTKR